MTPTVSRTKANTNIYWQRRFSYVLTAAIFACVTYLLLYMVGFVPSEFRYEPNQAPAQMAQATTTSVDDLSSAMPVREEPARLLIPKVGINTVVKNPVTTDVNILNSYLAEGAVRWPTSGYPGNGNLFIFGHSTSYETVWNQAYKTFNRIEELEPGDEVTVQTASGEYTYAVTEVEFKKDAAAYIPFDSDKNMLTLSTCNSFGSKEDRIIVRAEFTSFTPHVN